MMAAPSTTDLDPYYYLHNFHRLCESVEAQYADVLHEDELALLASFRALPHPARCLYVRLVARTGPWFRECKLHYPEIGSCQAALDSLIDAGLVSCAQQLDVAELAQLFTVAELGRAFLPQLETASPAVGVPRGKVALLQAIEALALDPGDMYALADTIDQARIVRPEHNETAGLLQLLFFGNRHQNLTEFVLQDLGIVNYFPYRMDRSQRVFSCRAAVDEYLLLAQLSDTHYLLQEEGDGEQLCDLARTVLDSPPKFASSRRRWDKLCNQLGRDLERAQCLAQAERLYRASLRHPARERRVRIHERLNQLPAARDLCEVILNEPWCEAEVDAVGRIQPRLLRKLDGRATRRRRLACEEISLTLARQEAPVEVVAAAAFVGQWQQVHYVENSLMNALFGLAFWEQIFAPVPGAFSHPYQSVPLDMYDRDFRQRREADISQRLAELAASDLPMLLVEAYNRHHLYQSHWVNWKTIDQSLVADAAHIIPAGHLLAIWQRILFDPRENRRGFPDLLALGERPGEYCMIEVKGPGDALQDSQKRWLRFFQANDIAAQVAWVSWCDD